MGSPAVGVVSCPWAASLPAAAISPLCHPAPITLTPVCTWSKARVKEEQGQCQAGCALAWGPGQGSVSWEASLGICLGMLRGFQSPKAPEGFLTT